MKDLEIALAAAATGAEIVRAGFGRHQSTIQKGRLDPVTEVDRASEQAIVEFLATHRPSDGILGEEGSSKDSGGRRWIIDPLDGTVNFIHGIPHISVSVGLFDGEEALVGVIHDPMRNEVFAAARGEGATCNGAPIRVSTTAEMHRAVVVTGFPYDHDRYADGYAHTVAAVLRAVNGLRRLGSAALDFAWVAAGRFDAYWEYSLQPWDMAAGSLIATEAGAIVTEATGGVFTPSSPHFVAANPQLHGPLCEVVAAALPPHIAQHQ
jgi:myo-inositol-1(or 4)-monophosphatase